MKIKITKQLPEYSISNKDKNIVVVEFPNCISTSTNKSFKWVPTYEQLNEIEKALAEIEIESWNICPDCKTPLETSGCFKCGFQK